MIKLAIGGGILMLLTAATASAQRSDATDAGAVAAIRELNRKFIDTGKRMDNAAYLTLWADDAVDLLPGMKPLVGKKAMAEWLEGVTAQMRDYKLTEYEIDFQEIKISGDWAFEWGTCRQTVHPPNGAKPMDNPGKILLILHREADGAWKFRQEMWNSSPAQK